MAKTSSTACMRLILPSVPCGIGCRTRSLIRTLRSLAARVSRSHARQGETVMRVLLVEDHQELVETVADVLRSEGMAVDVALDGQAALNRSTVNGYDVIVLDRDLPGVHGDEVCRALVAGGSQSRVLMLRRPGLRRPAPEPGPAHRDPGARRWRPSAAAW